MFFKRASSLSAVPDSAVLPANTPLVSTRGLEKSFPVGPGQSYVLRRITLDIKPGEFVSIMGPSGAGKSTLLHILGMHDAAWSGEYDFMGQPVHALGAKERAALQKKNIGFVFQSYHLLDDLTVYENIELPLSYRDVRKSERQGIVADVLDRFGIVGKKDLYPSQLSGGQQQLVGVARAVVANPGCHSCRRTDRESALVPGAGNHGAVQDAQRAGHDHCAGDTLGDERRVRQPRDQAARRFHRGMTDGVTARSSRCDRTCDTPSVDCAALPASPWLRITEFNNCHGRLILCVPRAISRALPARRSRGAGRPRASSQSSAPA